ncbi:MAG TPA: alpha/beta fold hydrolase [Pyrinomonadaceae bacterium]|nr:alpha/beta fold hydrolase [Pyrinomonadaceae bacterium]
MSIEPEKLTVNVSENETVTVLLYPAAKKTRAQTTIILGHGAGANQTSPFMRLFATGLAERGFDAMTFNFIYSERGRGGPDPKAKLESCYLAVIEAAKAQKKLKGNRVVIGGKSMGGRIASQVASQYHRAVAGGSGAAAGVKDIAGLVFLGYPLHPPGRLDKMRDAHLKDVNAPMLFIQGTRDPFGTPEELRVVIKRDKLSATVYVIEGGDHSFKVPKSAGVTQPQLYESILDEIVQWSRRIPNS